MSAEPDGDRDYQGAPADVVARALHLYCLRCTAEPGYSCRNEANEGCPPHNARLADASSDIQAERLQRRSPHRDCVDLRAAILPAGTAATPLPDVEVARFRQPMPLSTAWQSLCDGLEAAYGPGLVLRPDGEWMAVVRLSPSPLVPTTEETHRG